MFYIPAKQSIFSSTTHIQHLLGSRENTTVDSPQGLASFIVTLFMAQPLLRAAKDPKNWSFFSDFASGQKLAMETHL